MNSTHTRGWFSLLLCLLFIGIVRAGGHLLRLLCLALAIYLLYKLSGDFQKIRKGLFGGRSLLRLTREVPQELTKLKSEPLLLTHFNDEVDFLDNQLENILKQDPSNCVKSFVCQIAAINKTNLSSQALDILNFLKSINLNKTKSMREFQKAIITGSTSRNSKICQKTYKTCPYDSEAMLSLLRIVTT